MTEIPLPNPQTPDIFSYGFDKNLNRESNASSTPVVYDAINDVLQTTNLSGSRSNVQVFDSPGTYTWTKPEWASFVEVWLIAGGGGGGSGRRGAAGSDRYGGGGGSGGSMAYHRFNASILGKTEIVVVGAGGIGGAAVAIDNTNGNNGVAGQDSSFGSLFTARGVDNNGKGGTTTSGAAGSLKISVILGIVQSYDGGGGDSGLVSGMGGDNSQTNVSPRGGGGGGGLNSGNGNSTGGGGGEFSASNNYESVTGGVAGTAGGGNGGNGNPRTKKYPGGGTGGGGGGSNNAGTGGTGGNGALYGAGGGGGGASVNGNNSGAGGNGASGIAVIISS